MSEIKSGRFSIKVDRATSSTQTGTNGKTSEVIVYKGLNLLTPVNVTPSENQYRVTLSCTGCTAELKNDYKTIYVKNVTASSAKIDVTINVENKINYKKTISVEKVISENEISNMKSNITAIEQKADSISLRVEQTEENLSNNYPTYSNMNSAIDMKANSITSTVSKLYATKDDFNHLNIGSRNMLLKTSDYKTLSCNGTENQSFFLYNISDPSLLAGKTATLTFTYKVKDWNGQGGFTPQTGDSNWVWFNQFWLWSEGKFEYSATTSFPSNFNDTKFYIRSDWIYGTIEVTEARLVISDKKADWSPAPEDVDNRMSTLEQTAETLTAKFTDGFNMGIIEQSINGIKVYHNQINGENYTHMSPSGFYIRYKGEDIFICNENGLSYKGTITGSTINGGTIKGTEVTGGSLNVEGTLTANRIVCEDIDSPKYPGVVTEDLWLYVSTSGNDDSELESGATFQTFDGLLDKLPKNLNGHDVRIEMSTNITENVKFKGFHGGKIGIYMKGHTLYGYVVSEMGSARINIYSGYIGNATDESNGWGKIHPSKGYAVSTYTATVACADQGAIGLYNIDIYGADNYLSGSSTKLGVASQDFGAVYMNEISFYGCDIGARANAGGRIHDTISYNVCTKYGFYATSGGYITLAGNCHSGGKTDNFHEKDGGKVIVGGGATFVGGDVSAPGSSAPVVTTKTVTIKSTSGDTYRSSVYNNWKKDNTVRQGDYGYGDCNGIWLFGDRFEQFKGKNITKVVITISRQDGGQYASVDLNIKTHNYKSRPSGKPSYVGTVGTLGLAVNTSGKKTITDTSNAIITGLKAGTIKGIGLQSTYDSNHYAVCSGSVTVKITYTE